MIGKILGNRYEILEKIGGGGMSVVYKAKCNLLNRYVAIKVLRHELTSDPDFIDKFKQESLSVASLTHPNIVSIYDTGVEDDTYYIVMEYIKGETLKDYVKKNGNLDDKETIVITRQIAEALKHAHANKIIHRDIKPHNILLTEEGVVKVTDFGIAKASTSSTINNTSNVIGSVHYFSPEQARGGYVDEKSDIYSLGVVMYEMVTGVVPFDADNHISVAMKHIKERVVPPSQKISYIKVSKNIEELIMKCLEKHQSYRFQNIDEFLISLNKVKNYDRNEIAIKHKEENLDCPTMILPRINDDLDLDDYEIKKENIIEVNLIDENSDKAFKTFFSDRAENRETDKKSIKDRRTKNEKKYEEEYDEISEKTNYKITILAVLCALLIAVIGGVIGFRAMFHVPEVKVPYLIGKTEEEAKKITEDLGLIFNVTERVYDKEHKESEVISQSVEEGTKLKEKFPVDVVISKGNKKIEIPNLIGKYAIEVPLILTDMGLKEGKVTEEYNKEIAVGKIISQKPDAKTAASIDDKVDYVVSLGPKVEYTPMPTVIGLEEGVARTKILQNNLTIGQTSYESSDKTAKGIVMRQSMPEGQDVVVGSVVSLTVSSGPEEGNVDEQNPDGNVENPKEDPKEDEGTIKPGTTTKTFPLTITLPKDKDNVLVVVWKVTDDGRAVIFSETVETSKQSIIVNVEGTGTQKFEVYIDDVLLGGKLIEITFE